MPEQHRRFACDKFSTVHSSCSDSFDSPPTLVTDQRPHSVIHQEHRRADGFVTPANGPAARLRQPGDKIYGAGYSQGAGGASAALTKFEADSEADGVDYTDAVEFVLAADPRRNDGGILTRLPPRVYVPVLGVTFGWASFASVLAQRRADVQTRLRDQQLAYAVPTGERADGCYQAGSFVADRLSDLCALITQVEDFMLRPAFAGVFGDPGDESAADADGIVHVANRMMDFHERFLVLAERCRGLSAPVDCTELLRNCGLLMDIPLESYRNFIDDFAERVAEMPEVLRYARNGRTGSGGAAHGSGRRTARPHHQGVGADRKVV